MIPVVRHPDALRQMFAGLTEQTFMVDLGIADPSVTDYLVDLLVRFIRTDSLFKVRDTRGRPLAELVDMVGEAEQRQARPQREVHRHIGDFALFWTGVYPETLRRLQAPDRRDHLIDYCEQGKRAYYLASKFDAEPYQDEAPVLRRLSEDFELCSIGLNRVRSEWEKLPA